LNIFSKFVFFTVCSLFVAVGFAGADENKEQSMDYMKPYTGSKEFEQMKSLAGSWKGTGLMHGEEVPVDVIYETTAGGSVVIETLFPGTPHEMVSIYYEDNGKLIMKHFCMLKNQPELALIKSSDNGLEFDFIRGTNMDASKDQHMHSLNISLKDSDNMVQEWTPYQDGKAMKGTTTLQLSRAQ